MTRVSDANYNKFRVKYNIFRANYNIFRVNYNIFRVVVFTFTSHFRIFLPEKQFYARKYNKFRVAMNKNTKKNEKTAIVKLVRKSNNLVEANYKFDMWETRVFTKMLSMIRPEDEDFKDYRIYLSDIIRDFGLSSNKDAYDWLKKGARKLTQKTIKLIRDTDKGLMEFYTPIAAGVENPLNPVSGEEDMAYIDISFHPKMKPELLALKSQFTTYDITNVLKLPSSYSIRIYELLKQYEKIGQRKFHLGKLKETIGVIENFEDGKKIIQKDSYPLYGNFRQRVLLKAQRDLKKYTDIHFTFEPIKHGRKIAEIQFYIFSKTEEREKSAPKAITDKSHVLMREKDENPLKHVKSALYDEFYPKVKTWLSEKAFLKLTEDFPEQQVRKGIQYTLNRLNKGDVIHNIAGHIIAMSRQPELFDAEEVKKEVKKKRVIDLKLIEDNKKRLQNEIRILKSEIYRKEQEAILDFLENNKEAKDTALVNARKRPMSYYNLELTDEENFLNNDFFRMSVFTTITQMYPEVTERVGEADRKRVKYLENQLVKIG